MTLVFSEAILVLVFFWFIQLKNGRISHPVAQYCSFMVLALKSWASPFWKWWCTTIGLLENENDAHGNFRLQLMTRLHELPLPITFLSRPMCRNVFFLGHCPGQACPLYYNVHPDFLFSHFSAERTTGTWQTLGR